MKRSRPTRRGLPLAVVAIVVAAACGPGGSTAPTTPAPPSAVTSAVTATVTAAAGTTARVTIATTDPATTGTAVVVAPPGRLPYLDVSGPIADLLTTGRRFESARELETETVVRLRATLAAEGSDARVAPGSAADATGRPFQPASSTYAFVLEVRNGELGGDDSSSGYDLVVYAARDDTGWFAAGAAVQQLCSRGVTPGPTPLCV